MREGALHTFHSHRWTWCGRALCTPSTHIGGRGAGGRSAEVDAAVVIAGVCWDGASHGEERGGDGGEGEARVGGTPVREGIRRVAGIIPGEV